LNGPFNPNSAVLYRGPSELDGAPIVVVLTGFANGSRNAKTGDMLQTWIMRDDVHPVDALKGADASICGACPHRPAVGGACYVQVGKAPSNIWKAAQAGRYRTFDVWDTQTAGANRVVRLGAYGDPAAAPLWVWQALTARASAWTGYTHQWRTAPHLMGLCMASADSLAEAIEARAMGWRTFRVRTADETVAPRLEFICPASAVPMQARQADRLRLLPGLHGNRGQGASLSRDHRPRGTRQAV
jgi:hypothetical protein